MSVVCPLGKLILRPAPSLHQVLVQRSCRGDLSGHPQPCCSKSLGRWMAWTVLVLCTLCACFSCTGCESAGGIPASNLETGVLAEKCPLFTHFTFFLWKTADLPL